MQGGPRPTGPALPDKRSGVWYLDHSSTSRIDGHMVNAARWSAVSAGREREPCALPEGELDSPGTVKPRRARRALTSGEPIAVTTTPAVGHVSWDRAAAKTAATVPDGPALSAAATAAEQVTGVALRVGDHDGDVLLGFRNGGIPR